MHLGRMVLQPVIDLRRRLLNRSTIAPVVLRLHRRHLRRITLFIFPSILVAKLVFAPKLFGNSIDDSNAMILQL